MIADRRSRAGRDRLYHRRDQDGRRLQCRRHDHRRPHPGGRAAARVQAVDPGGVVRPLSDRRRRFREAARKPRQAAAERRELPLRAGDLRRARLRLPLRLPRPAASGDHPGAADPRIRSRPDRDRALRGLPRPPHQRRDGRVAQPGRHAGRQRDRPYRGALDQRHHHGAGRLSRRRAARCATSGAASRWI